MKLRHELAIVLLLVLVAAPARLLGLETLPPGLFHDEAYEGIDAVRIVAGARPAFLPENYGREPLYAYVMAALIAFAGPTAAAVRATSALFGLLAIPAAYFWGRVYFGPRAGLLMAALSAASYWLLHESRLGMRPIALPLFLALTSALVWLAARHGRAWAWPLAGLGLGLSLYTYLPARLFPLVIVGQALIGLVARRSAVVDAEDGGGGGAGQAPALRVVGSSTEAGDGSGGGQAPALRKPGAGLGLQATAGPTVLLIVAAVVALPLGLHFRANPEDASARGSVVSILATEEAQASLAAALGQNLLLNLGMFVWRGDDTLRHNLPYRPVFDWLIAPFFLLGTWLSLKRVVVGRSGYAASGAGGQLRAPTRGAGGAGGPAQGPAPTRGGGRRSAAGRAEHAALWLWLGVMLLPGLVSDSAPHLLRSIGLLPALFALPAFGLLAVGQGAQRVMASRFRLGVRADESGRADGEEGPGATGAYGGGGVYQYAPTIGIVALLAASQALTWRDYFVELPGQPGLTEAFDAPRAALARVAGDPPPGLNLELPTPGWSYATIRFLRPRSFVEPSPQQPARARFGSNAVLLGYDLEPRQPQSGQPARLTLYWRTLREMNTSYVETLRLLDPFGRVWWQRYGVPGFGTLPTDTWTPGEIVADHARLELIPGTPEGEYQLEIALDQPDGGRRRLPVFDLAGRQIGTSVRLPVRVGG
jgi:hypothetical protein